MSDIKVEDDMTLDEYVRQLPKDHPARDEYIEMVKENMNAHGEAAILWVYRVFAFCCSVMIVGLVYK